MFVILQLILNILIVPYTQNLGRTYLKNSNIDFLPTLISEKKFINVFKNLTIFVDKYNHNGEIDKIFINEKINKGEIDKNLNKKINKETEITSINNDITKKNRIQKFFDRVYFSIVTGTTLGYGDIYPMSNKVKIVVILQLLTTIIILFH